MFLPMVTNDDLSKLLTPMTSGSKKEQDSRKKTHNKRRRYHYHGVKAAEVAIAFWFGKEDIDFVVLQH
jgi:hypothetical protein